ncbi:MAG TPA: hypothetical protein VM408_04125 [Methylomirabilota bacterium]|nr:hypothetical protein [Methylomirabilota bacterium]
MRPRNAIFVGLMFVVVGAIYWGVQYFAGWNVDYAGVTLLILVGIAMGIMSYVLIVGSPND